MDAVSSLYLLSQEIEDKSKKLKEISYYQYPNLRVLPFSIDTTKHVEMRVEISKDLQKAIDDFCRQVKAEAVPAVFGQGSQTVYDKRVRSAKNFSIQPGAYPEELTKAAQILTPTMKKFFGYDIKAVPSKIAYYQEGDFFKPHRDTIVAKKHIGTLLIGTSNLYEGGLLVLENDAQVKIEPNVSVAFTTDCLHEVLPVVSGERAVLQYDVFIDKEEEAEKVSEEESCGEDDNDDDDDEEEEISEEEEFMPPLMRGKKKDCTTFTPPTTENMSVSDRLAQLKMALHQISNNGILTCHLYSPKTCQQLKGWDKKMADYILQLDPNLRCYCIPVIIDLEVEESVNYTCKIDGDLFNDLTISKPDLPSNILHDDVPMKIEPSILIVGDFAYTYLKSECFWLETIGNESMGEGDGNFSYIAVAMFFSTCHSSRLSQYEYKQQ
jgi:predicted 2-oxoglutarate/Fe(II)-dependent dioxygenase YbiX